MESSDGDFRAMRQRQRGAVAALIGAAVMSLFLALVYYVFVERDTPASNGWSFRVDLTIDVIRTLALILCGLAATRRPLLGALSAASLVATALMLQVFVVHQSLGFSAWSSLIQGVAIGFALAAGSQASKLRSKVVEARGKG